MKLPIEEIVGFVLSDTYLGDSFDQDLQCLSEVAECVERNPLRLNKKLQRNCIFD